MIFGVETWFIYALLGAVLAGVSNIYFKQAAVRGYNAELFSLFGSPAGLVASMGAVVLFGESFVPQWWWLYVAIMASGTFAAVQGMLKVAALQHIDSTIYFPLFKLLAPTLAIVFGITLFNESFTTYEWVGMILGLLVPLMLITKSENQRQNNLYLGLLLILVTGFLSAGSAAINKYAIDIMAAPATTLLCASFGVLVGTSLVILTKRGWNGFMMLLQTETKPGLFQAANIRAGLISLSMIFTLLAYVVGGTLAVVQTIHSMYILIPIVFAIIVYNEHWNTQKVVAVILSVSALALLG